MAVAATVAAAGGDVPSGKALYDQKCAICHGKDGVAKPSAKGSRDFNDAAFQGSMSAEAIAKVTAEGKGKMPAYRSTLKPADIAAIAAHIKTLAP
jgi:mono/diheme cytochrome c family protein